MNILKLICLTIIHLVNQAWLLPQAVVNAVRQRQRQVVQNELEAERLDRIPPAHGRSLQKVELPRLTARQ